MKKIIIISASFSGNKGAASMLESVIENVSQRFPSCRFFIFSPFPKSDKKYTRENIEILSGSPLVFVFKLLPISLLNKFLRLFKNNKEIKIIQESDLVLDLSGISFSDGRELFLLYNIFSLFPFFILKKKIIKCSQAMGRFNNFLNKSLALLFLPKLKLIVARGQGTENNLKKLNLKNVIPGSDLAFSLSSVGNIKNSLTFNNARQIVGISPSVVAEKNCAKNNIDYKKLIVDFANILIEQKYNIVIIPHSFSKDKKSRSIGIKHLLNLMFHPRGDQNLCEEIYLQIDNNFCQIVKQEMSARELRNIIKNCDFFIASRFHAMISALAEKVPTLVIGWGHKYTEVLKEFDLAEHSLDSSNINIDILKNGFNELTKNRQDVEGKIARKLPETINSSKKYLDYL